MTAATATRPAPAAVDLDRAPITVAWELTRACPLRCLHCRADAIPRRDPGELDEREAAGLVDQVADSGARVLVLTGGDPLRRPDAFDLIERAAARGLHVGFSPSVTGLLTPAAIRRIADAGAGSVHLSLDGAGPEVHDGLRGVRGSFERTLRAMRQVVDLGLPLQVGTTVTRTTVGDLDGVARIVDDLASTWSVFLLVPTGRAQAAQMLDAEAHDRVLTWLARRAEELRCAVRTTAAPTYRRIRHHLGLALPVAASANDGKGFCFITHTGEVHPSGFLPLAAGHVREQPLTDVYRHAPLMRRLRDPDLLGGDCGRCELRELCGGSRARAYALTGDELAADPTCPYVPPEGG